MPPAVNDQPRMLSAWALYQTTTSRGRSSYYMLEMGPASRLRKASPADTPAGAARKLALCLDGRATFDYYPS